MKCTILVPFGISVDLYIHCNDCGLINIRVWSVLFYYSAVAVCLSVLFTVQCKLYAVCTLYTVHYVQTLIDSFLKTTLHTVLCTGSATFPFSQNLYIFSPFPLFTFFFTCLYLFCLHLYTFFTSFYLSPNIFLADPCSRR